MAKGDHLRVCRGVYYHHGIDCGDGHVIHYTGKLGESDGTIRKESIHEFSETASFEIVPYGRSKTPDDVVRAAHSRLGENGYHLFGNNCEHFASWCKTGVAKSEQVNDGAAAVGGAAGLTAATTAGIGVISGAGAAAGLSGAGIMSGLASVGGVVGAGAVGGIALLGAAPAAITTIAMNRTLQDDESLPTEEREARQAGRIATTAGAAVGTVGTIATISAAGVTAGLSGAGITSGLAAIGGTVGGGMLAGTAMAVAAPAVVAAGVGYGAYKVWQWFTKP